MMAGTSGELPEAPAGFLSSPAERSAWEGKEPCQPNMLVIGHRGAPALAPENTWESFDRALSIGVDAIETDARRTLDGRIVLIHDAKLNRTTNGAGLVARCEYAAIRRLDAGSWFGESFRGARVPALGETLDRYGPLTQIVVEIKEPEIASAVLEEVQGRQLIARVTFTSFHVDALRDIRRQAAAARTGLLVSKFSRANTAMARTEGFTQICPPAAAISPKKTRRARAIGLEVRPWQVASEDLMHEAIRCGVDGMTIDHPERLLAALGREAGCIRAGRADG